MPYISVLFFFNDTATTEIYTLSLHDALPILKALGNPPVQSGGLRCEISITAQHKLHFPFGTFHVQKKYGLIFFRSEEHTSELQSHSDLVCRLLLEKKKNIGTRS